MTSPTASTRWPSRWPTREQPHPGRCCYNWSTPSPYLTKPFAFDEFLARVRALIRREPMQRPTKLCVGALVLDPAGRTVHRGEARIAQSAKEFALLQELMRRAAETLNRALLIEHVWDFAYDGGSNVVDVYVRYLRDKVDRPFGRNTILTMRGAGYRLDTDALRGLRPSYLLGAVAGV